MTQVHLLKIFGNFFAISVTEMTIYQGATTQIYRNRL